MAFNLVRCRKKRQRGWTSHRSCPSTASDFAIFVAKTTKRVHKWECKTIEHQSHVKMPSHTVNRSPRTQIKVVYEHLLSASVRLNPVPKIPVKPHQIKWSCTSPVWRENANQQVGVLRVLPAMQCSVFLVYGMALLKNCIQRHHLTWQKVPATQVIGTILAMWKVCTFQWICGPGGHATRSQATRGCEAKGPSDTTACLIPLFALEVPPERQITLQWTTCTDEEKL